MKKIFQRREQSKPVRPDAASKRSFRDRLRRGKKADVDITTGADGARPSTKIGTASGDVESQAVIEGVKTETESTVCGFAKETRLDDCLPVLQRTIPVQATGMTIKDATRKISVVGAAAAARSVLGPIIELSDACPPLKIVATGLKLICECVEVSHAYGASRLAKD